MSNYSKYFNLIGTHSVANVKYELYQLYGYLLVSIGSSIGFNPSIL